MRPPYPREGLSGLQFHLRQWGYRRPMVRGLSTMALLLTIPLVFLMPTGKTGWGWDLRGMRAGSLASSPRVGRIRKKRRRG